MRKQFSWLLVLILLCTSLVWPALAETITVVDAVAYLTNANSIHTVYGGGSIEVGSYKVSGAREDYSAANESGIADYVTQMQELGWKVVRDEDGNTYFFLRNGVPLVCIFYTPYDDNVAIFYQEGYQVEVAALSWSCFSCGGSGVCSCGDGYLMGSRCSVCGGTAICPWCHGDGMISANENYGNRPNAPVGVCDICYGSGTCQICMGAGRISGIATYGQGGSDYVTCSGCNGSGRCEYCNGTGLDN